MRNAGKYNKRIVIARSENAEVNGFVKLKDPDKLIPVLKCWAQVKTTSGITLITSHTDFEKALTKFTIRYPQEDIDRSMFILYNNRIYSIEYINNIDEADEELELQAKAVTK